MIEKFLNPILDPIKQAWGKFMGVKGMADNLKGDVGRVKQMAGTAKKKAADAKKKAEELQKQAAEAAKKGQAAAGQAQAAYGQAQGAIGQAQGHLQGFGGKPGAPGAPSLPPGMPQPGMPPGMAPAMMPPPGMTGMAQGGMPGMPGMPPRPGMPGPMPMPMPMGGPPGPGVRTMAIMAGGTAGAAIAWLVPLKGPQRGELFTLKPQSVIGKDPTCDVVFNDPFMSGRHATIRAQNGLFVLEDHSTNGTWVNDRRVQRHELVDNDFVKCGQTIMKFKAL